MIVRSRKTSCSLRGSSIALYRPRKLSTYALEAGYANNSNASGVSNQSDKQVFRADDW